MSGYNVQTPSLFAVRDPQQLVQANLSTLNATLSHPDKQSIYDFEGAVTFSAEDLLNGYIIRSGGCCSFDNFDSASNIIDSLRRKLLRLTNQDNMVNGTKFDCTIYNASGDRGLSATGSDGVSMLETIYIGGMAVKCTIMIIDQARLGEGHNDTVCVCVCGGVDPLLYFGPTLVSQGITAEAFKTTFASKKP